MKELIIRTIKLVKEGTYRWIPSSLAFYFMISFIPLLFSVLIVTVRYVVNDDTIIETMIGIDSLQPFVKQFLGYIRNEFSNISIFAVVVLLLYSTFLSSNGIRGVIYAINSFFGFEKISYIKASVLSYIIGLVILVSIFIMVIFISVVPTILEWLDIGIKFTKSYIYLPFIVYAIMHFIYAMVSNFELKAHQIYKGALFTSISIYILIVLSSYIFYLGRVSIIYGSLAIVILVTHFMLYISYAIYAGIALNVASYQLEQEAKQKKIDSNTM